MTNCNAYLKNYAHPLSYSLTDLVTADYDNVLTLPAFDEPIEFLQHLLPRDVENLLLILVVNAPDNLDQGDARLRRTQSLWNTLTQTLSSSHRRKAMLWGTLDHARAIDLLCIDCVSPGHRLPPRAGVGGARRIAADCALALMQRQKITSHWIHCSDADARLPPGYFGATRPLDAATGGPGDIAAVTYPYRHFSYDDHLLHLATNYELHLRYFVERLRDMNCPYAFHSLGSTLAVRDEAYAAVRGFPVRSGAEDFYLLNKLAKTGRIACLPGPELRLEARLSQRVPFGTGPALARLDSDDVQSSYATASFVPLKEFYLSLHRLERLPGSTREWLPRNTQTLFQQLGFDSFCAQLSQQAIGLSRFKRACLEWFDAFRVVKYLHICRSQGMADTPLLSTTRHLYHKPRATPEQLNNHLINCETEHIHYCGLEYWLQGS